MTEAAARGGCVVVETEAALAAALGRMERAPALALDIEANGLFAFRPKMCTVQLAWQELDGQTTIALIDALAVDISTLGPLLGGDGPVKVLHDLTFDARLLDEAGARLARVRDTSVAARLLGRPAIGLAALVEAEFGVTLDKRFQQHDWAKRPLAPEHIDYLAEDVRYLLALDERLATQAAALDIAEEVADECAYKLDAALRPSTLPPAYSRIKGAVALEPRARSVLRRIVIARDELAMAADVPPFRVLSNELAVELAREQPRTASGVRSLLARSPKALAHAEAFLRAVERGIADGDVPPQERALFERPAIDRADAARRKACEARVSAWRRGEARRRGVDEQAVLPGHVARDLVDVLLGERERSSLRDAIAALPGIGSKRLDLYGDALAALAMDAARTALPSG